jgi:hypothetical protein
MDMETCLNRDLGASRLDGHLGRRQGSSCSRDLKNKAIALARQTPWIGPNKLDQGSAVQIKADPYQAPDLEALLKESRLLNNLPLKRPPLVDGLCVISRASSNNNDT